MSYLLTFKSAGRARPIMDHALPEFARSPSPRALSTGVQSSPKTPPPNNGDIAHGDDGATSPGPPKPYEVKDAKPPSSSEEGHDHRGAKQEERERGDNTRLDLPTKTILVVLV